MGYCHDDSRLVDRLAYQRVAKELIMQRLFNWLVIAFLCFLTVNFYNSRNDLSEVVHSRYADFCIISERQHRFQETYLKLSDRLNAIILTHARDIRKDGDRFILYAELQDMSVKVIVDGGSGSGVLFTREIEGEQKVFIWTAGHVAASLQQMDGTFKNATIKFERRYCGQVIRKWELKAKVIAFSNQYTGEDLALLEITEDCAWFRSAVFADDEIQPVGTEVIHVGSTAGFEDSVSLGIVSQTDRVFRGKMYDQTSTMAYPGSSGGGVYTTDGKCIGLVTLGVGPGLNFYVPMRRLRVWAKKEGIEWAMDKDVPVPLSRTPTELEMAPREAEVIISLPPSPVSLTPPHGTRTSSGNRGGSFLGGLLSFWYIALI